MAEVSNNTAGMLAKFYTSNRDFLVNQPKEPAFYDTPIEVAYFRAGGIMPYVLEQLLALQPETARTTRGAT